MSCCPWETGTEKLSLGTRKLLNWRYDIKAQWEAKSLQKHPSPLAALQTSRIIQSEAAWPDPRLWTWLKGCQGWLGQQAHQWKRSWGKLESSKRHLFRHPKGISRQEGECLKHTRLVSKWRILKTVLPKGEGREAVCRSDTHDTKKQNSPELSSNPPLTPWLSSWAPLADDVSFLLVSSFNS